MNVGQLIQTLVATVVGGLIVIATNWLTARGKKRQDIRDWYEKTYIIEGIDPLVVYFYQLGIYFYNKSFGGFIRSEDIATVPVEAMVRVRILFDNGIVSNILPAAHELLGSYEKETNQEASRIMIAISRMLLDCRKELLEVIATKVRNKHSTIDASQVVMELSKMSDELINFADHFRELKSSFGMLNE